MTSARGELAGLLRALSDPACQALALAAHRIAALEKEGEGLDLEERTKRLSQYAAERQWAAVNARRPGGESAEDIAEAVAVSILAVALGLEAQR
jgi:hypothetical protein